MHVNARRHRQPLKEIQGIGRLARTWQRNISDEPRPAFEQAQLKLINEYIRRGERARTKPMDPIEMHSGLMHEHDARSARVIDRTLRNGLIPDSVALSFRDVSRREDRRATLAVQSSSAGATSPPADCGRIPTTLRRPTRCQPLQQPDPIIRSLHVGTRKSHRGQAHLMCCP